MKTTRRDFLEPIRNPAGLGATLRNHETLIQRMERAPVKFSLEKVKPPKKAPVPDLKPPVSAGLLQPLIHNGNVIEDTDSLPSMVHIVSGAFGLSDRRVKTLDYEGTAAGGLVLIAVVTSASEIAGPPPNEVALTCPTLSGIAEIWRASHLTILQDGEGSELLQVFSATSAGDGTITATWGDGSGTIPANAGIYMWAASDERITAIIDSSDDSFLGIETDTIFELDVSLVDTDHQFRVFFGMNVGTESDQWYGLAALDGTAFDTDPAQVNLNDTPVDMSLTENTEDLPTPLAEVSGFYFAPGDGASVYDGVRLVGSGDRPGIVLSPPPPDPALFSASTNFEAAALTLRHDFPASDGFAYPFLPNTFSYKAGDKLLLLVDNADPDDVAALTPTIQPGTSGLTFVSAESQAYGTASLLSVFVASPTEDGEVTSAQAINVHFTDSVQQSVNAAIMVVKGVGELLSSAAAAGSGTTATVALPTAASPSLDLAILTPPGTITDDNWKPFLGPAGVSFPSLMWDISATDDPEWTFSSGAWAAIVLRFKAKTAASGFQPGNLMSEAIAVRAPYNRTVSNKQWAKYFVALDQYQTYGYFGNRESWYSIKPAAGTVIQLLVTSDDSTIWTAIFKGPSDAVNIFDTTYVDDGNTSSSLTADGTSTYYLGVGTFTAGGEEIPGFAVSIEEA